MYQDEDKIKLPYVVEKHNFRLPNHSSSGPDHTVNVISKIRWDPKDMLYNQPHSQTSAREDVGVATEAQEPEAYECVPERVQWLFTNELTLIQVTVGKIPKDGTLHSF